MDFILLVFCIAAGAAIAGAFALYSRWPSSKPTSALFVFSHPDDETMFFTPTIRILLESGVRVRLLCLSVGLQAPGLRPRPLELVDAARILGVQSDDVEIVDLPVLQDGMRTFWHESAVAASVAQSLSRNPADIVVTFDKEGVSGHLNHKCTHAGVLLFAARTGSPPCYELETVPVLRKFSAVLDVVTSWLLHLCSAGPRTVGASPMFVFLAYPGLGFVHSAMMRGHSSQYVWFRWLYVAFSRYAFVNTLKRII